MFAAQIAVLIISHFMPIKFYLVDKFFINLYACC